MQQCVVCVDAGPAVCFASFYAIKASALWGQRKAGLKWIVSAQTALTPYRWSIIWSLNSSATGSGVAACIYDEATSVA